MQAVPPLVATTQPLAERRTASAGTSIATAVAVAAAAPAAGEVSRASPIQTNAATSRNGLTHWDPQLHQQLGNAQLAQSFLDTTAAQLQALKDGLNARLAGLQGKDGALQQTLNALAATWQSRATASGSSLDSRLGYHRDGGATQRFSVRGLDVTTLTSGPPETLVFAVAGSAQGLLPVSVAPGATTREVVRRFDQALAPAGLRATSDSSGALIFSVAESAWPAVRDSLSIKGDGIRFPTGQLSRAKVDAEPPALTIEPLQGAVNDAAIASARQALQQIMQSMARVKQARANVTRDLERIAASIYRLQPAVTGTDAVALASGFQQVTNRPRYEFASVAGSLTGISRARVLALVTLPDAT